MDFSFYSFLLVFLKVTLILLITISFKFSTISLQPCETKCIEQNDRTHQRQAIQMRIYECTDPKMYYNSTELSPTWYSGWTMLESVKNRTLLFSYIFLQNFFSHSQEHQNRVKGIARRMAKRIDLAMEQREMELLYHCLHLMFQLQPSEESMQVSVKRVL